MLYKNQQYEYWVDEEENTLDCEYHTNEKEAISTLIEELYSGDKIDGQVVRNAFKYLCWYCNLDVKHRQLLNESISIPSQALYKGRS